MTGKDTDESTHVSEYQVLHQQLQKFIYRKKNREKQRQRTCFPKQGNRDEGSGLVMILHGYGFQYRHKKLLFYQTVISNV